MDDQLPEQRALAVRDQRNVEILGDEILAVRTADGAIYLPLRTLCETLGLDRPAQMRRIRRDAELREDFREIRVATTGGVQTIQALRVEVIPFWLAGVTISKVKPELQEKLRAYRRWVVRKVYEAFMLELGIGSQASAASAEFPLTMAPTSTLAALAQVREMGLAMAHMAESQMALEQRQGAVEARLGRAAAVVGELQRRLTRAESRLDPANAVTDEQAAVISNRVKALAVLLTEHDPSKNHFGGIFGELYRRCGVSDYRSIRQHQYEEVLGLLDDWREAVSKGTAAANDQPA